MIRLYCDTPLNMKTWDVPALREVSMEGIDKDGVLAVLDALEEKTTIRELSLQLWSGSALAVFDRLRQGGWFDRIDASVFDIGMLLRPDECVGWVAHAQDEAVPLPLRQEIYAFVSRLSWPRATMARGAK